MPAAVLASWGVPHNHGGEEYNGNFVLRGPGVVKKDAERLGGYLNGNRVIEAITEFVSTQYKSLVDLVSHTARIVAFSAPETPAGVMAGRVSTVAGDIRNALNVLELPKKFMDFVRSVVALGDSETEESFAAKIGDLFCRKITDLIDSVCDGLCLLDRHVVSLGNGTMRVVGACSGAATLVCSLYNLIFENAFTGFNYYKNWDSEEKSPTRAECVTLGLEILQNTCYAVFGGLVLTAALATAACIAPWLTFAFLVTAFAFSLTGFFVQRIWARPMELSWEPEVIG